MKLVLMIIVLVATSYVSSGCTLFCWLCDFGKSSSRVQVSPGPPIIFSGQVVSNFNEKIVNAMVEVNGQATRTDKNGAFTLPVKLAGRYVINIRQEGFGLFSRSFTSGIENTVWTMTKATVWENQDPNSRISVKDNLSKEGCQGSKRRPVDWTKSEMYAYRTRTPELKKAFEMSVKAASQPTECSSGIRLSIPAGSLEYKDGKSLAAQDKVTVALATVDLFSPNGLPGDFVFIRQCDGELCDDTQASFQTGFMESFGAGSVTVTSGGQPVQLKANSTATLVIPVDPNQKRRTTPPETIPLLVFDEFHGVWVHEGIATLNAAKDEYTAEVTHFSEYNADVEFTQPACVRVDASAIGQTFDLWQSARDETDMEYHPKLHLGLPSGVHAVWALPPIDNLPLNQGLTLPRTGHKVVLTAYESGTCPVEGNPSCKKIDFVVIPDPSITPALDLPKQTFTNSTGIVPNPPYSDCKATVTLFKEAAQAGAPTNLAVDIRPWGVTVTWNYTFDSLITADNKDGFMLEEAACTANCTTTPAWGLWQVPLQVGTAIPVQYANTANDANSATNRTASAAIMRTIMVPRHGGLYKYRVKAYYGVTAQFTANSSEVTALVSNAKLTVENLMTNNADDAAFNDDNILRFRIAVTRTALTSGPDPERLASDRTCGGSIDWIPAATGSRTEPVLNEAPHYFVWLELGYWYTLGPFVTEPVVDPSSGVQCSGSGNRYKRMYGKQGTTENAHLHRSLGGEYRLPTLPPGQQVTTTNYVEVKDHYAETIKIQLSNSPSNPTIKVFDENGNDITNNMPVNQFHLEPNQPERIIGW